jgi:hypothetical protein
VPQITRHSIAPARTPSRGRWRASRPRRRGIEHHRIGTWTPIGSNEVFGQQNGQESPRPRSRAAVPRTFPIPASTPRRCRGAPTWPRHPRDLRPPHAAGKILALPSAPSCLRQVREPARGVEKSWWAGPSKI